MLIDVFPMPDCVVLDGRVNGLFRIIVLSDIFALKRRHEELVFVGN
jgi:hypothetical protein